MLHVMDAETKSEMGSHSEKSVALCRLAASLLIVYLHLELPSEAYI